MTYLFFSYCDNGAMRMLKPRGRLAEDRGALRVKGSWVRRVIQARLHQQKY
jgi:hypothetical protein